MIVKKKILLVVVLYNQKLWTCNTYNTIIKNNDDYPLFIYDNSPVSQHTKDEFADNIKYVNDPSNSGISVANNRAASYACEIGAEWLLLLDQDTCFAPNILNEYRQAVADNPNIKLFAPPMQILNGKYMSPVRVCFHLTRPAKSVPIGVVSLRKYAPINSGLMINVQALLDVGGYNENVPLDFCEYQFERRLMKKHENFYVLKLICKQEFSDEIQNTQQKLKRYEIFCHCLKNCEKNGFVDRMAYSCIVIKRALSLVLFCRSFKPIVVLIKKYL